MIYLVATIALQVALVIHIIRTGRNQLWLWAVILLPVAGSIAYFIVEVLPGLMGSRTVRTAHANVIAKLDPERELRAARDALALSETVRNRARVGDALLALGRGAEAREVFEAAIRQAGSNAPGGTDWLTLKLAAAAFNAGDATGAKALLDAVPALPVGADEDRRRLLLAQVLAATGEREAAARTYADIVSRLPGDEARCRYAALLLDLGRRADARAQLEEVEARAKRLSRQARGSDGQMYTWAAARLSELRVPG